MVGVWFCRTYNDVEVESDVCVAKPGGMICRETDGVVACLMGCEGKFAFEGSSGLHYHKS